MKSSITLIATCLVAIGSVSCNPVPTSAMLSDESLDNMYGKLKSVSLKGSHSSFDSQVGTPPVEVKMPMHPTKDWNDFSDYEYANAEDGEEYLPNGDSENDIMSDDIEGVDQDIESSEPETFSLDEDYDDEYGTEGYGEDSIILDGDSEDLQEFNDGDIDEQALGNNLYSIDEGTEPDYAGEEEGPIEDDMDMDQDNEGQFNKESREELLQDLQFSSLEEDEQDH